ncbi:MULTISPECIES: carotenoid oxygenase family protein [unclassified Streptomyces]|uniref:carotenoid oxygenase family protein n=1 Tax=unclassified Streptomyces TaxID=2593676 RepID=UPI0008866DC5|nr:MULTISPECIES: carotenoid oxygenase family protein [unclassified Streptomyces]PBC83759.1 carotenoid cleavage dioxygenase [Streptomyces sp. 2321.6]SDR39065.1 carotenoid cleavage dioxygenase [Streptomyces sp. KS_16]SED07039.1 carotenoid cleavage dioxygenase [Streptomyces sp. 2133.1]SNC69838.1 carotenoid cleavage dioxygenase [Streptomyces sp. 2114.4]
MTTTPPTTATASTAPAPHMAGNFAPVKDEVTAYDLPVTGTIPPELTGWFLRNGPNPRDAASAHWFFGDGMVHGLRLEGGRAVSYRNRWVRTSTFEGEPTVDAQGRRNLAAGVANTHIVRHAGRTLALVESSLPYEIDCRPGHEMETLGAHDFGGRLTTAMTAHPKTCPTTGELHFFGYGGSTPPYLTYHRADASGELVISRPIDVPGHTMMHDFHLTAGHVIFMDLPVVHDRSRPGMPFAWDPEYGARLGVLRRDDPYGEVRWLPIDPCYVFHALNAHDEGDQRIVLYVSRYAEFGGRTPAHLWRWTIDLTTGMVAEEQLDDRFCEFPRVDDRLAGLPARFGHATTGELPGSGPIPGALLRYDLQTGAVVRHDFGPGRTPAEAVFAPADDRPGGPGWLITYVYDASTDTSDLVVLDTEDISAAPVATVHLPQRVPYGFHGNWLPDPVS